MASPGSLERAEYASPDRCRGVAEPSPVVAEENGLDLAPDARVIGVEPGKLVGQELLGIDEPAVERHEGQRLEPHHFPRAPRDPLRRRHQHEILQPDAVMAFAIIARLVGEDHAGLELDGAEPRQALRSLMHREIDTYT